MKTTSQKASGAVVMACMSAHAHDTTGLTEEALEMVAGRFKVLGEPMRLRLLHALQNGEKTVTELITATSASQANVSKHLSVLMQATLVGRRKEGVHAYYFIKDPVIFDLCGLVCAGLQKEFERGASHFGAQ